MLTILDSRYVVVYEGEHPNGIAGARQKIVRCLNGYGASIVGGGFGLYGDGVNTFELAVLRFSDQTDNFELCFTTPITDEVLAYQTLAQVSEILKRIDELRE